MRIGLFVAGLGSILSGLAIPLLGVLWIFSSAYRRARFDAVLADPSLLAGVGWRVGATIVVTVALIVGGGVVIARSLRRA